MGFKDVILWFTVVQVTIGVLQWLKLIDCSDSNFGITGMFFNPAPFSILITSIICFNLPYMVYLYRGRSKYFFALLFLNLIGFGIIIKSFSRASWVSLFLSVLILVCYLYSPNINFHKKKGTALLIMIVCFGIFLAWIIFLLKPDSAIGRILIWKISGHMILDQAIFGVGEGNFASRYVNYQGDFFKRIPEDLSLYRDLSGDIRFVFNDFIQVIVETGLTGFVIFAAVIFMVFIKLKKSISSVGSKIFPHYEMGLLMMILSILSSSLFSYPLNILPFNALLFTLFALVSNTNRTFLLSGVQPSKERMIKILMGFVLMISSYFFLIKATNTYYSLCEWKSSAENAYTSKNPIWRKIYENLNDNAYFLGYLGNLYMANEDYANAILVLERAKLISPYYKIRIALGEVYEKVGCNAYAISNYLSMVSAYPNLLTPKYYLAKAYLKVGAIKEFRLIGEKILNQKIKIESEYLRQMKREISFLMATNKICL